MRKRLLSVFGILVVAVHISSAVARTVTFAGNSRIIFFEHTKAKSAGELGMGWKGAEFANTDGERIMLFPMERVDKSGGVIFSGPDDLKISPSGRFVVFYIERVGVVSLDGKAKRIESRQYCPVLDVRSGCIKSNQTGEVCGGEWDPKGDLWIYGDPTDTSGNTDAMLYSTPISAFDVWETYAHAVSSNLKMSEIVKNRLGMQNIIACDPLGEKNKDYYLKIESTLKSEHDYFSYKYLKKKLARIVR